MAASETVGHISFGVEKDEFYFKMAADAIPKLIRYSSNRGQSTHPFLGDSTVSVQKAESNCRSLVPKYSTIWSNTSEVKRPPAKSGITLSMENG